MVRIPEEQAEAIAEVRAWVSNRLRALREGAGWSQSKMADKMGVHLSRVSDFENNRSDYQASTVYRYARALGVPVEEIFAGAPGWRKPHGKQVIVIGKEAARLRLISLGVSPEVATQAVEELSR